MPLVFQGLNCSNGPRNISYSLRVSAPYLSITSSGLTTLYLDLDIFSTSAPHTYFPSSKIKLAPARSDLHCLKRSKSRDRKSTRLNSSHVKTSYAVFCLKKQTERAAALSPWSAA